MASTDEKRPATGLSDDQSSPPDGSYGERRRRAHEILALQQSHLDRLENELTEQLQQVIGEVAESVRLADAAAGHGESSAAGLQTQFGAEELRKLEEERDSLAERLESAEAVLKEQATSCELDARETDDLQRRFESAVAEARELKRANAELEEKLKQGVPSPTTAATAGLDWETQKKRLLAALEADDDDNAEAVEQRATIEDTIRATDQIVAEKDTELAELKRLLEEQAGAAATVNSDAAEELFNRDERILQEREKLTQMQAEWREKIGQAEIDVSVERAKLARERALLDEKVRQLEAEQERRAASGDATGPDQPTRGRWLARLGLKDLDETP